jgi:RNA polymerase sigma factor (sigma-70 family)
MPNGVEPGEGGVRDAQAELNRLMEQIRGGSQEAVRELLAKYGGSLVRAIRRRLGKRLRSQFDSADFVQAVWASFFTDPLQNYDFGSPEELIAYLTSLAANKVCDAARQGLQARKRNLNRVRSLDGSAAVAATTLAARTPTPSQVMLAKERWDRLLQGQPPHCRHILLLLRQGHTLQEVAQVLDVSERTVRRVVDRAARRIQLKGRP